jgi:hypothetical protein
MKNIDKITQTLGGYPIKDLRYKERDNLFVGLVEDPICGKPNLHNGYVVVVWRRNGKVEPRYGSGRTDLEIDVKLARE